MAGRLSGVVRSTGRVIYIDCGAIISRLEGKGVPLKQAEALTEAIIDTVAHSTENISHTLTEKVDRSLMLHRVTVESAQRESQKDLKRQIDMLRGEMKLANNDLKVEFVKEQLRLEKELGDTKSNLVLYSMGTILSAAAVVLGYLAWKKE